MVMTIMMPNAKFSIVSAGTDQWYDFMPLYRVDYNGANILAGSILFLEPGAFYEIILVLSDPDGGSESRTETITTRGISLLPVGGRLFHASRFLRRHSENRQVIPIL